MRKVSRDEEMKTPREQLREKEGKARGSDRSDRSTFEAQEARGKGKVFSDR